MTIFPGTAASELRDLILSKLDHTLTPDQQADSIVSLFRQDVQDEWESRETTSMGELPGRSYLDTRILVCRVPRETETRTVRINRAVAIPKPKYTVGEILSGWGPGATPSKLQYDAALSYLRINGAGGLPHYTSISTQIIVAYEETYLGRKPE